MSNDERTPGTAPAPEVPIYLVGGVNEKPLRHCVWGYFHDLDRALSAARVNETDINEAGYYPLAVVVEANPGLISIPRKLWWFKFDGKKYLPIEAPEWTKRYGWMGFPSAREAAKQPDPPPVSASKLRFYAERLELVHSQQPQYGFLDDWADELRKLSDWLERRVYGSDTAQPVKIEVRNADTRQKVVEVYMTLEDFSQALLGLSCAKAKMVKYPKVPK